MTANTGASSAATTSTGFCTVQVCYTRVNDLQAQAVGHVTFGWNGTTLGKAEIDHTWVLSGAKSATTIAVIRFTTSHVIEGMDISGQMFNGYPGRAGGGNPISGTYHQSPHFGAGLLSYNWKGYSGYDNHNYDHNNVMEFAWTVRGYSGFWYAYTRSLCSHSPDKTIYRFDAVDQLPGDPYGGGWKPNA